MSYTLGGGRITFFAGTDKEARELAEDVVNRCATPEPEKPPSVDVIVHRLSSFATRFPPPSGKTLRESEEITGYDSKAYAKFLAPFANDAVSYGNFKSQELSLLFALRPIDKQVGKELVRLVTDHFKMENAPEIYERLSNRFVDDWKLAAASAEYARAITKDKVRAFIVKSLKWGGKKPANENRLKEISEKDLITEIAGLAAVLSMNGLWGHKVKGVTQAKNQMSMFKSVRPEVLEERVIDKILSEVMTDDLLKNKKIKRDSSELGESSGLGESSLGESSDAPSKKARVE